MAVFYCQPLEHQDGVKMLREHRMAIVVTEPLVQLVLATTTFVLWGSLLKFLTDTRSQPVINEVQGIFGDHAKAVLAHPRPLPTH
jgi:hypothetical protein